MRLAVVVTVQEKVTSERLLTDQTAGECRRLTGRQVGSDKSDSLRLETERSRGRGRAASNRKSALSRSLYAHPKSPTRNAATLSLPNRLAFALQKHPLFFVALPPFFL